MSNNFNVRIDNADMEELLLKFGNRAAAKVVNTTRTYTQKLQSEARNLLKEEKKADTGELIRRIQPKITESDGSVRGEVSAGAKHSRFVHEGTKHDGEQLIPYFVPFAAAPSLLNWAKRNKVIYKKNGKWFFKGKSGREYGINTEKGGMLVRQEAVPYFQAPFERLSPEYFEKIKEILS